MAGRLVELRRPVALAGRAPELPAIVRIGALTLLIALGLVLALFPFAWALLSSFKPEREVMAYPPSFGISRLDFENYYLAWKYANFSRYVSNTAAYALTITTLTVFTTSTAGYAFGRLRFPGRDALFMLVLSSVMIPGAITLIPLFTMMVRFPLVGGNDLFGQGGRGFYNSFFGLVLPGLTSPTWIFLLRQFFRTLPSEMEDAARIDGASELTILWKIILPLSGPALTTVALFEFQGGWNAFVWPLIISSSESMYTIQVGLASLYREWGGEQYGPILAGSIIATVPVLLLFAFGQRYFTRGIALTGLK